MTATQVPAARALADLHALAVNLVKLNAAIGQLANDRDVPAHIHVALCQTHDSIEEAHSRIEWAETKLGLVARDTS